MLTIIKERKKMDRNTFNLMIKEFLERNLQTGSKVLLQKVRKNNGVLLDSIIIHTPNCNISPTIYMDVFYEMYMSGMELEEVAVRILAAYYKGRPKKEINLDFFKDFEKVKPRIAYRLINAKENAELLEEIPHILFMDLAICFFYAFWDEQLGNGTITIYNKHMEWWGTNMRELMALACKNTPGLFPAEFETLKKVVETIYGEELDELHSEACPLYVLTNEQKVQGAICLLYDGMLEQIANRIGGSFYVLPSSIHEVILFKESGEEDIHALHQLIREVNSTQLSVEERLSDYPYYYDKKVKKLICLKDFLKS